MRILVAHNHYQQAGGEDAVFDNEVKLLREAGHVVETLAVSNDTIKGAAGRAGTALLAPYNPFGRRLMARHIADFRPDVVHVHNFFPRLSPAIFDACHAAGVPAVWTLHNFRVACASAFLMRDGKICDDCLGAGPMPAIRHRCYRGSMIGSASLAGMIALHDALGTWQHKVARFIALTEFARDKFIAAGLPAGRVVVKPNFAQPPFPGNSGEPVPRESALYVGRLSPEKGVGVLVDAWQGMDVLLTIIGDGPERAALEARAGPHVHFLGHRDSSFVQEAMRAAALLIVPSIWFEMFPMTVVEAMANGTPVLASAVGALAEIVADGVNGLHFRVGDAADLRRMAQVAFSDRAALSTLGRQARAAYEEKLSPAVCLADLERIYRDAISELNASLRGASA